MERSSDFVVGLFNFSMIVDRDCMTGTNSNRAYNIEVSTPISLTLVHVLQVPKCTHDEKGHNEGNSPSY